MKQHKLAELIFDFSVYPRVTVDEHHMGYMREAVVAGATMPPVVVCKKTLRIVDGFHRVKVYLALYGPEHEIEVLEKSYSSDAELLIDSIRYNASHGRTLSRYDRVHCILLAEKLEIANTDAAAALGLTGDTYDELRAGRVGRVLMADKKSEEVPLKATIRHMAGKKLTRAQLEVNRHLGGMNQLFYVNQLTQLIESDLLDTGNRQLMEGLRRLGSLIRDLKIPAA
jgi:hypothetical protein